MFSLKRIAPKLWHLHFDSQYDMAMHLLRFNACPGDTKTPHEFFTIAEFKKCYKKYKKTKTFTYPKDWAGFNVSSDIFEPFLQNPIISFPDKNARDELMLGIVKTIISIDGKIFSMISTFGKQSISDYKHEIAHAFYFLNKNYRKKMRKNIAEISKLELEKFYKILIKFSYTSNKQALDDEFQAFAATGILDGMKKILSKKIRQKFIATFKQYYKQIKR